MSGRLASALAAVERAHGPGSAARLVRRLDADDEGGIVLTLEVDGAQRWFRAREAELLEIFPGDDEALPAARSIAARERAGEGRIVSWRPGRRIVARFSDASGERFVKGHRARKLPQALAAQRAAEERVPATAFRVARLLSADAAQATLTLEGIRGDPLDADRADRSTLVDTGRRLARFQQARADDLAPHGRADEIALLERAAARVERAGGSLPEGWTEVLRRLQPLAARPPFEEVAAHRDLHDGQILVAPASLALLDFDLLARAERGLDPANLAVHLELRSFERGAAGADARARAAVEALLEGLGRQADRGFRESFAFHGASAALRLALLCVLRPAWTALGGPMLARARAEIEACERA